MCLARFSPRAHLSFKLALSFQFNRNRQDFVAGGVAMVWMDGPMRNLVTGCAIEAVRWPSGTENVKVLSVPLSLGTGPGYWWAETWG